jgi:hypothetical protein
MSRLFPENTDGHQDNKPFNKEDILHKIKLNIPPPWFWCTMEQRLSDDKSDFNPVYDLLIMRNKTVDEVIRYVTPFTMHEKNVNTVYSIVIGVFIKSIDEQFINYIYSDEMVNASIVVDSFSELLNFLKKVDCKEGGIKINEESK